MTIRNTSTYHRMLAYLNPQLPLFIFITILSIIIVVAESVSLWLLGTVPQTLFSTEKIVPKNVGLWEDPSGFINYHTINLISGDNPLVTLCVAITVFYTIKSILSYVSAISSQVLRVRIEQNLRADLYGCLLKKPMSYFDTNRSTDSVNLVINSTQMIMNAISDGIIKLLTEPVRIVFTILLLLIISPKFTIVAFLLVATLAVLIQQIGRAVKRRNQRWMNQFGVIIGRIAETMSGIRTVKMSNGQGFELDRFQTESRSFLQMFLKTGKISAVQSPVSELLTIYATVLLFWVGGNEVLGNNSTMSSGDFFRFIILLFSLLQPIKNLGSLNNTIQSGIGAGEMVFKVMDEEEEIITPVDTSKIPTLSKSISFQSVSFTYKGCEQEVLHDISMEIPAGHIVALVGSSGAGKSTILDILPRFYDPSKGKILIDGLDINSIGLTEYRSLFGIVAQDNFLFMNTIAENIAYGKPNTTIEEITEAARIANALEFIEKMPNGFNTIVGERGVTLSGGQRQRIAIARAIVKNPPILILDEATSSLDTESEQLVQDALSAVMTNRTTVVVAHRLSTIRKANTILVLDQGKIVEQGNHEELLAVNGRYNELYTIQFGHNSNG